MAPVPAVDADGLQTIFDPATCTRKGLCPVTKIRHPAAEPFDSHSLYYEQHGTGKTKVLFIMGLNSTSFAWTPQVAHFGALPGYSVLVFDNRGVGNSGAPRGPYTTSEMSEDVIVLLKHVGWTEPRDLHVVGISLGGMISQELATRIPEQIISLTLCVTTAGGRWFSTLPPRKGTIALARLMAVTEPVVKIPIILDMVFPRKWLDEKAEDDAEGRTNWEVQTGIYMQRMEITRPQTFIGAVSQMSAGLTHHVAPARLASIAASIPKVLIVTGDEDNLVDPANSRHLAKHMPQAEFVEWAETGHAIHAQRSKRFNELLARVFREGEERVAEERAKAT